MGNGAFCFVLQVKAGIFSFVDRIQSPRCAETPKGGYWGDDSPCAIVRPHPDTGEMVETGELTGLDGECRSFPSASSGLRHLTAALCQWSLRSCHAKDSRQTGLRKDDAGVFDHTINNLRQAVADGLLRPPDCLFVLSVKDDSKLCVSTTSYCPLAAASFCDDRRC